ncbi:hypothetical protein M0R45_006582 [Rubus argutus]|uniref:Uncharacterized protein n=1 Tax=Rubus argutus TaxID=59490 RepID=A0AAW1YR06_RUBAR
MALREKYLSLDFYKLKSITSNHHYAITSAQPKLPRSAPCNSIIQSTSPPAPAIHRHRHRHRHRVQASTRIRTLLRLSSSPSSPCPIHSNTSLFTLCRQQASTSSLPPVLPASLFPVTTDAAAGKSPALSHGSQHTQATPPVSQTA